MPSVPSTGGLEISGPCNDVPADKSRAARSGGNDRRCAVTRRIGPRDGMVRFVVAPDGTLTPDLAETLPGRGLWVTASREVLASPGLARAAARSVRRQVSVPADLPAMIERLLEQRCRATLGLARRAGLVESGFDKVRSAIVSGDATLLLTARTVRAGTAGSWRGAQRPGRSGFGSVRPWTRLNWAPRSAANGRSMSPLRTARWPIACTAIYSGWPACRELTARTGRRRRQTPPPRRMAKRRKNRRRNGNGMVETKQDDEKKPLTLTRPGRLGAEEDGRVRCGEAELFPRPVQDRCRRGQEKAHLQARRKWPYGRSQGKSSGKRRGRLYREEEGQHRTGAEPGRARGSDARPKTGRRDPCARRTAAAGRRKSARH